MRFLAALLITLLALPASAATFTLTGDVDGRIRDINNVSIGPTVDVNNNEVFLSSAGFRTNTILEFDLSFISPGETITAIDLSATNIAAANTMFVNAYSGNGTLDIADGSENTNQVGLFSITAGSNGPLSLSTAFANSLLGTSATHIGFNIGVLFAQSGSAFSGFSVTFTTASSPPPVPLPAAGWMLLAGLGGMVALRRRKTS